MLNIMNDSKCEHAFRKLESSKFSLISQIESSMFTWNPPWYSTKTYDFTGTIKIGHSIPNLIKKKRSRVPYFNYLKLSFRFQHFKNNSLCKFRYFAKHTLRKLDNWKKNSIWHFFLLGNKFFLFNHKLK